jgi:hypothetical protein
MYSKGSGSSIFATIVSKVQTSGQELFEVFNTTIAYIFHGDDNPNLVALTTALEQDASEGQAYLVVMNNNVDFNLLHNLQRMDRKFGQGTQSAARL